MGSFGAAPEDAFGGNRCRGCGWLQPYTQSMPRQRNHAPCCEYYRRAHQAMLYVEELRRVASDLKQRGVSGEDDQWRKYLEEGADEITMAACKSNVVYALAELGRQYNTEIQKRHRSAEAAESAEMLMKACNALAHGELPDPIKPSPT